MITIEESYQYCLRVARTRAKNFYYSFVLLSVQQRKAMCAIYAFMRYCDDLSDEPGASKAAVDGWRADLEEALEGRFTDHPVWPAFHHTVRRFGIPHEYFRQMIDGISSDLEPRRLETFDELYRYCYQVASGRGADNHSHLRVRHAQRAAAGGEVRRGVSVDEHSARYPRGCRARADLSSGRGSAALRRDGERSACRESHSGNSSN